ncbi:unnamed protein product [Phyllotreta striolata]|uniref:TIR domain-containing protein n=1 Tax=Phyllotreta striolata TaxID=444603 RepID=A0A9N9XLA6_PHYSR|nr:unnamed protein product [Phyllotreta striolata]
MDVPILFLLTGLVALQALSAESTGCSTQSDHCLCLFTGTEYEFQCPPVNKKILIHSEPNKTLNIDCDDVDRFDTALLPVYKGGDNIFFRYRFCPLPDGNFRSILDKLDVHNPLEFQLDDVTVPESSAKRSMSKEVFEDMPSLRYLSMANIDCKIDDDVLEHLTNLTTFELSSYHHEIISTMKFPESLEVLYLTSSGITEVPIGVFENLTNLQRLHLWGNKIGRVRNGAFAGLKNLISLELSVNSITDIEENSFADLVNLKFISLRLNKLIRVPAGVFKHNERLESIRMEENRGLTLPDYIYANKPYLRYVKLKKCDLKTLPGNIFKNSTKISTIILSVNSLKTLPESLFDGLSDLKQLDLSLNQLTALPDDIFYSLTSLEELILSYNHLTAITNDLFRRTDRLKRLLINKNRIASIEVNSFGSLTSLTEIDLSFNQYPMNDMIEENPLSGCTDLVRMNLSHNLIDHVPDFNTLLNLETVDFSYNKIRVLPVLQMSSIPSIHLSDFNLSDNLITFVDFTMVEEWLISEDTRNNDNKDQVVPKQIQVNLKNNPLTCDCLNYNLTRYCQRTMYPKVRDRVALRVEGIKCTKPDVFRHVDISALKSEHVFCEMKNKACPKQCKSYWRPFRNFTVFDCSNRNLTSFPRLPEIAVQNIELNLSGNVIHGGLDSSFGYRNVKNLYLSNNKLRELKWIPLGIERLTLDRNELTHLDPELLEIMDKTSLTTLKLSHNPWSCGCSALNFQIFIQDNYKKLQINSTDVICRDDNKPLVEKHELCKSIILVTVLPVFTFLVLTVGSLIFYIYYRQEVKIWLFSKNLCMWFVSEEELDEDKSYDIFLSYSHKDEDFVVHNLLPVLESGPHPYKICIHVRDWEPGKMILTNVNDSIQNSRRTLVVLSNNFLDSVWGIMEFKAAHLKALEEGRLRLIVVKYGELDEKRMDPDLKAYLKTNTYIEWGQPWFWNKLKYALPHSNKTGFYKTNQKHANVMLKIDDKFELTNLPVKQPESTPPVPLDPALLKKQLLNFDNENAGSNQPMEVPLVVNT